MSELEQNIPDDFWRKAFEEAAETPPPRVWDAVERRLDESEGTKILPLWGAGLVASRPLVWGTGLAAAVALLLVGWWVLRTTPPETGTSLAQQPAHNRADQLPTVSSRPPETLANRKTSPAPVTGQQSPESIALTPKTQATTANHDVSTAARPTSRHTNNEQIASRTARATTRPAGTEEEQAAIINERPNGESTTDSQSGRVARQKSLTAAMADTPPSNQMAFAAAVNAPGNTFQETAAIESRLSFDRLHRRNLRLRTPGAIQRIVWFQPAEPAMEPDAVQSKREAREVWASVSMMPGAFDPAVGIQTAQASFSRVNTLSNTSASQSSIGSRANFSVAYQAGAGVQLTERWSVESGVGYLSGRSTVDSPVQAMVLGIQSAAPAVAAKSSNLYVDALRVNVTNNAAVTSNYSAALFDNSGSANRFSLQNNYNPQERQSLSNNYQFVQVPVQVGYQLRPRKRLGLALIGGFLSNIFVRNTVGDELVVTSKDGVYRPVSWAATMGARFRYRPSRQWSASLAGVYQPSLGLGTRPESIVQSRPTSTGMSFGIDYHF